MMGNKIRRENPIRKLSCNMKECIKETVPMSEVGKKLQATHTYVGTLEEILSILQLRPGDKKTVF